MLSCNRIQSVSIHTDSMRVVQGLFQLVGMGCTECLV